MSEFVFRIQSSSTEAATIATSIAIEQADCQRIKSSALLSTFFRRADLEELLAQSGAKGLRFYPALDLNGSFSLLAVATNILKRDIVSGDTSKCFVSEGALPATRATQQQGVALLGKVNGQIAQAIESGASGSMPLLAAAALAGSNRNYAKVFFDRATLENLLADQAVGIRFFSSRIVFGDKPNSFSTLAAVTVHASGEEGTGGVLSALPCPPDCGGGGYTDDNFNS